MERLTAHSPATIDDLLDMAGSRMTARKAYLWMHFKGQSLVFRHGDALLGVAFFLPAGGNELEFCMTFKPAARPHMLSLCRFAHLTLERIADTGKEVFCHVMEGNRSGRRLARLTGFSMDKGTKWHRRGNDDVGHYKDDFRG